MYWATTTFRVTDDAGELAAALGAWRDHIRERHARIREVRCYRFNAGTSVVWQEGFDNFVDYQALIDEEDGECEAVMLAVFRHLVPGTRESRVWSDGF